MSAYTENSELRPIAQQLMVAYLFGNDKTGRDIGEKLLANLVYAEHANRKETVYATDFALEIGRKMQRNHIVPAFVAKAVFGKLKDHPELYWHIPELEAFLMGLLEAISKPWHGGQECTCHPKNFPGFTETEWMWAERAVRLIAHEKDPYFLTAIEKMIEALEKSRTGQIENPLLFSTPAQIALLRAVQENLQQAIPPDEFTALEDWVTDRADISGGVRISCRLPNSFAASFSTALTFHAKQGGREEEKLKRFLGDEKRFRLHVAMEGMECADERLDFYYMQLQFSKLLLAETRGRKRLTFYVKRLRGGAQQPPNLRFVRYTYAS